ncbi:uncharacterized protein PFL1_06122 [Pseudozyma flocculosa PF-1]|uniref:Probable beta-glucosidase G n=2 Tax=Pseudozyma flocculosa TaxID=84751 RepID=A0A5C3F9T7_9BASI|nr:uncharacterized protein PFL1_06122 [Pseudozyma flocculosa PF-1]EPQ26186.1 hypothetical protein PFL1_06122 [Pseudozyma flocculosa PF-1]SPO40139.1 probable beta-glucosidase [Pseudozyma flocculosa]
MVAIRLSALWVAMSLGLSAALALPMDSPLTPSEDLFARDNGKNSYTGPYAKGTGAWESGFAKARQLVDQMTIEEKVNVTTGYTGKCVGYTGTVPRLGLTALCLQDGPAGVRPARRVSQFPAGVTTAATWDRDLFAKRAEALADEFRNKGVNIWLGPVTGGPLGRAPRGGRNWEGWGSDEYLSGEASYLTVKHAQQNGLMACSKHYIAYEQETYRNPYNLTEPYAVYPPLEQRPISSNLDDRTSHELYMWSFAEAVRAGTATIMCSYNEVNQTHACEDDYSLNTLLKKELGFNGAVISDWGGTWSNKGSALGGLDVTMPGTGYKGVFGDFFGKHLVKLVEGGKVPESRLDDMVMRVLGPALSLQDLAQWPEPSFDVRDITVPTNNVRDDHHKIIKKIGEESLTLLKNKRSKDDPRGLPLKSAADLQSLAVLGQDAGPAERGMTSCGDGGTSCRPDGNNGTLTLGGGSGWAYPPYIIDPLSAIQQKARESGFDVNHSLDNYNLENIAFQANHSEAALVFVNAYATENQDRQNLTLWANGEKVIKTAAKNNNNTIVIIHAPGQVEMSSWAGHENITAILYAYLPGQESGSSLPPVLWGEKSPSGKLPFTIARKTSDYPPNTIIADRTKAPQADFTEKLLIDHKWFDAKNIEPLYEFGFGMSYSSFEYGDSLRIEETFEADESSVQKTNEKWMAPEGSFAAQGSSLYDTLLTVSVDLTNTGSVTAAEVAQLYVSLPKGARSPPKLLRGFEKVNLAPGETRSVAFKLRKKDLAYWSTVEQAWKLPQGDVTFRVGASSRKLSAKATKSF